MYASIVVLSALVAVAAASSHPLEGDHADSPMEFVGAEPQPSKRQVAWSSWGSTWHSPVYPPYYKRDTANAEAQPNAPVSRERRDAPAAEDSSNKEKRQIFYSGLGYAAPIAYSGYYGYPYIFKRDTNAAESHADAPVSRERRDAPATVDSDNKEKRQIFYSGYGYTAPLAYSGYLGYPYIFKRDTTRAESHPEAPVSRERRDAPATVDSDNKEKRQIIYSGYGYGYTAPLAYSGYGYPLIFKRDTSGAESHAEAPVSRERRDTAATDDSNSKEKRQILFSSYGYPYASALYSYPYARTLIYKK